MASNPKGQLLTAGTGRGRSSWGSSEDFKLTVIQINWVGTDVTNKPDAEFYLQLPQTPKPFSLKPAENFLAVRPVTPSAPLSGVKGEQTRRHQESRGWENKCGSPVSSVVHSPVFQNKGIITPPVKMQRKYMLSQQGGVICFLSLPCKIRNKEWKTFAKLLR